MSNTFKKDDFIKWTHTDEEGEFYYIGRVEGVEGTNISFVVRDGGMFTVPLDNGKFENAKRPKDWKEGSDRPMTDAYELPITSDPIVRPKKGSKYDQIVDLLRVRGPMARKDAIQVIVDAGLSTPAGASTHFNKAKKVLGW